MSITPQCFLGFATEALRQDESEFASRNSASRAYYAAYHCCHAERSRCPSLNEEEIKGSHDKLYTRISRLAASPANDLLKKMGYLSQMMKSVRHSADYDLGDDFDREDALQQIRDAQKVISHWNQLREL
jgi:uncharacterized protein (UPF0332 family)